MTNRRWTPLAAHLMAATPRSPRPPQADAARALAATMVGAVLFAIVWGWLR